MPGAFERWLESIGLGKYASLLSENGIDLDIVGELGEADLKDLGISLGDRKRLLRAISALSADADVPEASSESSVLTPPATASSAFVSTTEAQRRQLTVMFCDLVGSTALSRRLDPEDLREAVQSYQRLCAGIVARFDGFVAQYLGDGILVYFGWPRAHENDAERAVRAGLGIVEAMKEPEAPRADSEPLAVRIGIATGPVVVGDLLGSGAAKEATATGETPNLAARLQEIAPANGIVIAASTHALTGTLFECADLGERQFKGYSTPLSVWQVVRERFVESRFDAARASKLAPFVGREHEVGLILERWQEAKAGEGQVVLLSGEAGIGKSRIAQNLRELIAKEPHTRLRYQCSPYYTSTAFYPFVVQLGRAVGFSSEDTAETKLDRIEAMVAAGGAEPKEVTPLFATLLAVPTEGRYPSSEEPSSRVKERTIAALAEQLIGLSVRQPVLLIFEDAHWADPTSLEVLDQAIGRITERRVLALITARPEFEDRWAQHAHVTSLTLNRLSRSQASTLIDGLTTGKTLPQEVLAQIIAKTDGVPLFVEELTRTVLESGLLTEGTNGFELNGPLTPLAIPATLQDSLTARLDRLDAVKEVAQIGAAIGREFSQGLLSAIAQLGDAELGAALDRLVTSGLVFRKGSGDLSSYVFKHALVQDVAYNSLLRSRRQQLHQRIARALTETFPEVSDAEPEIVAHHFTEAGLIEPAIQYWHKAGELAAKRSANVEALAHFNKGLESLSALPKGEVRDSRELDLQVAMANPLMAVKGYASPEVRGANARALELCKGLGSSPNVFPVLYTNWAISFVSGRITECRPIAQDYLRRALEQDDLSTKILAHRIVGSADYFAGCTLEAESQFSHAIELCGHLKAGDRGTIYGQDIAASALCVGCAPIWSLGYPQQAIRRAEAALARAHQVQHRNTLAYVQGNVMLFNILCMNVEAVAQMADQLVEMAKSGGLILWELVGQFGQAWSYACRNPQPTEIEHCEETLAQWRAIDFGNYRAFARGRVAALYGDAGDPVRGMAVAREVLNEMDERGERFSEADLHRIQGQLEIQCGHGAEAEKHFQRALTVARKQASRMLELRSAVSIAGMWKSQGKIGEAQQLLAPMYAWFGEGFDTPDLRSARTLLDELQAQAA